MRDAGKLLESGRLAIVPGVGYPNPSRSHFRSREIWQSARLDERDHTGLGWVGRGLDGGPTTRDGAPAAMLIGPDSPPPAIRGRRSVSAALDRLDDYALSEKETGTKPAGSATAEDDLGHFLRRSLLDAYTTADRLEAVAGARDEGNASYPESELARRLRLASRLIKAGLGTRVYYLEQGDYDTHGHQLVRHAPLLEDLSASLRAFLDDLAAARLDDRVIVMIFSEFGRRVAENGSMGTDHGTAGPVFLAGPAPPGTARHLSEPHRPGRRRPEDDGGFPPRLCHRPGRLARPAGERGPGRPLRALPLFIEFALPPVPVGTIPQAGEILSDPAVKPVPTPMTREGSLRRLPGACDDRDDDALRPGLPQGAGGGAAGGAGGQDVVDQEDRAALEGAALPARNALRRALARSVADIVASFLVATTRRNGRRTGRSSCRARPRARASAWL